MTISIITATFNSSKTVGETVESIANQTYKDVEQVLVDSVSSDNTLELAKKKYAQFPDLRHQIICEKDKGIADAFNKGVLAASGEIIGFLNSDDYLYSPEVLAQVAKAFEDPSVDFVHGDIFFEDLQYGSSSRHPLMCDPKKAMPFNHPTLYARKRIYDEVGLFDIEMKCAMDYEWILRLYNRDGSLKYNGVYLSGTGPMVFMRAGGMSWSQELRGLSDSKLALKKWDMLNLQAKKCLWNRKMRIKIRNLLDKSGLNFIIRAWRKLKWG